MRIGIVGSCDKHDLVLMLAVLLRAYRGIPAAVAADDGRAYGYLDGEASGVSIHLSPEYEPEGLVVWDYSSYPPSGTFDKLILVTSCERASVEFAEQAAKELEFDALVVVEAPCSITPKYIYRRVPTIAQRYEYEDNPGRRIDWIYNGQVSLKRQQPDFVETVNGLLIDLFHVPKKDLKKLWQYAAKRGWEHDSSVLGTGTWASRHV